MIRFCISLIALLSFQVLSAQVPKSFPVDDDAAFAKTLGTYIASNNRPEAKELGLWIQNSFLLRPSTPEALAQIKETANLMLSKKIPLWPNFYNYGKLLMQTQTTEINATAVDKNFKILKGFLIGDGKESIAKFNQYVDYLNEHYKDKIIFKDKAKQWLYDQAYTVEEQNGEPVYLFKEGNLSGYTTGDSLLITGTAGRFYPLNSRWEGIKGRISWRRVGFPEDKIYAEFNAYALDLSKPDLSIDSVLFTFQPYSDAKIRGKFADKLTNSKAVAATYPQFTSFERVPFKGLSPELKFNSGIALEGSKLYATGTSTDAATLSIVGKNGNKVIDAKATRFLVTNFAQVDAENTHLLLYLPDSEMSVMHPGLTFSYNIQRRQVKATREDKPEAKIPVMSDFFKMNFYVDQIVWSIDSSYADMNSISVNAQVPSVFESYNYYVEGIENKYKQFLDFDPLTAIVKSSESSGSRLLMAEDVAATLRAKDVPTVESMLFKMMEDGYLYYDRKLGLVTIFDKMILHSKATIDELDYDNLRFASNTRGKVGKILLDKKQVEVYGVQKLNISKSQNMLVSPSSDTIYISENRGIKVKGILTAGKVNFYSDNLQFNYEGFQFEMKKIDSMLVMVPTGEVDKYGNVFLQEINTPIQSISGTLYIDDPNNRSGKRRFKEYPYFDCKDSSLVYFDKGSKGHKYNKDSFHFMIYPFVFDSMSTFQTEALKFKGKLISAGIFPAHETALTIQEDLTLGTNFDTPEKGLELYKGQGNFIGNVVLNSKGLKTKGILQKQNISFDTDNADIFPDSLHANITAWNGILTKNIDLPDIKGSTATLDWISTNDSLSILPQTEDKVLAYQDKVKLNGTYKILNNLFFAKGEMEVADATVVSDSIELKSTTLLASPAKFKLSHENEKVFSAEQTAIKLDFDKNIAYFNSSDSAKNAQLSKQMLNTNIKNYQWNLADKTMVFDSKNEEEYFEFEESLLKGVRISAASSVLNMNDKTLTSTGVSQILVADSKVIPEGNKLTVTDEGTFSQFKNAVVVFNADTAHHRVEEATVDILSQEKMNGTGVLRFKAGNTEKTIKVEDFSTSTITIEPEKGKAKDGPKYHHYVKARGVIAEEDNYRLDEKIVYKGDVNFNSMSPDITLDGFSRLDLKATPETEWFKIAQSVDLKRAFFGIDSLENEFRQPVYTGLMLDMNEYKISPRVLQSKEYSSDRPIFKATGVLKNLSNSAFVFGPKEAIENPQPFSPLMKYDDETGEMNMTGQFDLLTSIEPAKMKLIGSSKYHPTDTATTLIQGTAAFDFYLLPEINDQLHRMMLDYNAQGSMLQLTNNKNYSTAFSSFIDNANTAAGIANDMEKFNTLNIPLDFPYNYVLGDLKLFWDEIDGTFKSLNPAAVFVFGGKVVQQKALAFVEIGPRMGKDFINIYIKTSSQDWFYFRYTNAELGIISSDEKFNNYLAAIKPEKRMLKSGKEKIYEFMPASIALVNNFVARMEEFRERLLQP